MQTSFHAAGKLYTKTGNLAARIPYALEVTVEIAENLRVPAIKRSSRNAFTSGKMFEQFRPSYGRPQVRCRCFSMFGRNYVNGYLRTTDVRN
jgi:hypothetical protein